MTTTKSTIDALVTSDHTSNNQNKQESLFGRDGLAVLTGASYALTTLELVAAYHLQMPVLAAIALPQLLCSGVFHQEYHLRTREEKSTFAASYKQKDSQSYSKNIIEGEPHV